MKKNTFLLGVFILILVTYSKAQVCGQDITDIRDSKVYKTVLIGTQCWMAENLNYGTIINSTQAGSQMTDNGVVEKYCWHDSIGNCDGTGGKMKRGGFYEWQEAMQYYGGQPTLPVQGVCPAGWHIPSNAEWNTLMSGLGGTQAYQHMLKGGSSGFNSLLTGYRCTMTGGFRTSAIYDPTEWRGYYWTSEQTDAENAPILEIAASQISSFSFLKSVGLSIRCIKNTATSIPKEPTKGFNIKSIHHSYNNYMEVEFDSYKATRLSYNIINVDGKVLFAGEYFTNSGRNTLKAESVVLPAGIYILRLNDQIKSSNKKFMTE